MNEIKQTTSISRQTELMQRILEIRYTDIEGERQLCKQLLDISEREQYLYGSAFANVYLLDSHLALGEYGSCDFYLFRASFLCREYGYDDLMAVLCNCAGLYYQKLNDDQTALDYFLEGKRLCETLSDNEMLSKLYNNIGYSFGKNGDLETAKNFIEMAIQSAESGPKKVDVRNRIGYLTNLGEVYKCLGDAQSCKNALERCEALSDNDIYSRIRLKCGWLAYYTVAKDKKRCGEIADELLESDFKMVEEQFMLCDMAEGMCENLLTIGDNERARKVLDVVLNMEYHTSILLEYRIQGLKILCWETFGEKELLAQAYKEYYDIAMKVSVIESESHGKSMVSKINIHRAMQEREEMQRQMCVLENASQLDDLTGLFNRRHFNKMVSKLVQKEDTVALGFIMMDVDYFKQYNDFYGHFKGDSALQAVARVLQKNIKEGIYATRYGGDEFVCLCVNIEEETVEEYVRNIIGDLRDQEIPHEKNKDWGILSISVGYCIEPFGNDKTAEFLLNLADKALYSVKEKKRGGYMRVRPNE